MLTLEQYKQLKNKGYSADQIVSALNQVLGQKGLSTMKTQEEEKTSLGTKISRFVAPLAETAGKAIATNEAATMSQESETRTTELAKQVIQRLKDPNLSDERKQILIDRLKSINPDIISQVPELSQTLKKTNKEIAGEAVQTGINVLTGIEAAGGVATGLAAKKGLTGLTKNIQTGALKRVVGEDMASKIGEIGAKKILSIPTGFSKKSVIGRALISAGYGASYETGAQLRSDNDFKEAVGSILTSGGLGALLSFGADTTLYTVQKFLKSHPKIAAVFTRRPEATFQRQFDRPKEVKTAIKTLKTKERPEEFLTTDVRNAVKSFRSDLSDEYGKAIKTISQEAEGKTFKLNQYQKSLISSIDDNIKTLKWKSTNQDLSKEFSFESMNNLYKELNSISKGQMASSAKGADVRTLKSTLKKSLVKTFGGDSGAYNSLLKDYSAKASILNGVDDFVKAYKENPRAISSAARQLQGVFNDNRYSYIDALAKLEEYTGKSFLDEISALTTRKAGVDVVGEVGIGELVRWLLTPIFAARPVAATTRAFGTIANKTIPSLTRSTLIRKGAISLSGEKLTK